MITEIECKMSVITDLATSTALNGVENKISSVSDLVKKTDYNAKISNTETKYLTTSDCNKFTGEILRTKIKEKRSFDKSNISNLVKNSDLKMKLTTLARKAELKSDQHKIVKLQAFTSSYFCSKSHFEDDGMQNFGQNGSASL